MPQTTGAFSRSPFGRWPVVFSCSALLFATACENHTRHQHAFVKAVRKKSDLALLVPWGASQTLGNSLKQAADMAEAIDCDAQAIRREMAKSKAREDATAAIVRDTLNPSFNDVMASLQNVDAHIEAIAPQLKWYICFEYPVD